MHIFFALVLGFALGAIWECVLRDAPYLASVGAADFVNHILGHLAPGQIPICKICGKDINQISAANGPPTDSEPTNP